MTTISNTSRAMSGRPVQALRPTIGSTAAAPGGRCSSGASGTACTRCANRSGGMSNTPAHHRCPSPPGLRRLGGPSLFWDASNLINQFSKFREVETDKARLLLASMVKDNHQWKLRGWPYRVTTSLSQDPILIVVGSCGVFVSKMAIAYPPSCKANTGQHGNRRL